MKPLLILNISWMKAYKGIKNDLPVGKFRYMSDGSIPHEIFNFQPYRGQCFGYAPVQNGTINLQRLGANADADQVDNVLVVWTATHPDSGRYIIGWYDGATVHTSQQIRPSTKETSETIPELFYSVTAPHNACHLLPIDERSFLIPTARKGFPGISSAFYADENSSKTWVDEIRQYISTGHLKTNPPTTNEPGGNPVDVKFRKLIEESAVNATISHYKGLGFKVISREQDNIGWDLEARLGGSVLRLEVKGLSSDYPQVEVTPNEYKAMTLKKYRKSYRLCIVTQAHKPRKSKLRIFRYDTRVNSWVSDALEELDIKERTAARISISNRLRF